MNFPLTDMGISLFSLICGMTEDSNRQIHSSEVDKKAYIKMLKVCFKYKPNLEAVDNFHRTCLHHAARASNLTGVQFIIQAKKKYIESDSS